ncbi:putative ubiquitin thioesterase, partial [Ophiophagus hannah]
MSAEDSRKPSKRAFRTSSLNRICGNSAAGKRSSSRSNSRKRRWWQRPSMSLTQGDSLSPLTSLFFVEGRNEMNLQIAMPFATETGLAPGPEGCQSCRSGWQVKLQKRHPLTRYLDMPPSAMFMGHRYVQESTLKE